MKPDQGSRSMQLTLRGLRATEPHAAAVPERLNLLGPPRPVVCLRCAHTTAECTCCDAWLAGRR